MKKTLVVLAAGMGSRFGGLKQIEPVGPNGEFIIDYSIYDAIRSGFEKVVFIIKEENYDIFKETIGKRIESHVEVEYAFQDFKDVPKKYNLKERVKPLGTAHALYCARKYIDGPFAVLNADDFYGYNSIKKAAEFLDRKKETKVPQYILIGYRAINTITESGSVKRGICNIENDKLVSLTESIITKEDNGLAASLLDGTQKHSIDENTLVSMNLVGFTRDFIDYVENNFLSFLEENKEDLSKVEYLIPDMISKQINSSMAEVIVKETIDKWYGITYKEDKEEVVNAIKDMIRSGIYSDNLWK